MNISGYNIKQRFKFKRNFISNNFDKFKDKTNF